MESLPSSRPYEGSLQCSVRIRCVGASACVHRAHRTPCVPVVHSRRSICARSAIDVAIPSPHGHSPCQHLQAEHDADYAAFAVSVVAIYVLVQVVQVQIAPISNREPVRAKIMKSSNPISSESKRKAVTQLMFSYRPRTVYLVLWILGPARRTFQLTYATCRWRIDAYDIAVRCSLAVNLSIRDTLNRARSIQNGSAESSSPWGIGATRSLR